MIKYLTKALLIALFVFVSFVAKAQLGFNYSQYSLGVATGFNQVYGDAQTQKTTVSAQFNFTYNYTPYTNFVFEIQLGTLAGGDSLKTTSGRQFTNDYSAFIFRGQLQMGELIDYSNSQFANVFKNLYISAGIGYVVNHITDINRYSIKVPGYYTPGLLNSNEPFLPLRLGYEFKVFNSYDQPAFNIDLGVNYNHIFGDELDGFEAGVRNDVYFQYTIGVKFAIGGNIVSYRKLIHY